jgi:hypothetical protein
MRFRRRDRGIPAASRQVQQGKDQRKRVCGLVHVSPDGLTLLPECLDSPLASPAWVSVYRLLNISSCQPDTLKELLPSPQQNRPSPAQRRWRGSPQSAIGSVRRPVGPHQPGVAMSACSPLRSPLLTCRLHVVTRHTPYGVYTPAAGLRPNPVLPAPGGQRRGVIEEQLQALGVGFGGGLWHGGAIGQKGLWHHRLQGQRRAGRWRGRRGWPALMHTFSAAKILTNIGFIAPSPWEVCDRWLTPRFSALLIIPAICPAKGIHARGCAVTEGCVWVRGV